MKKIAFFYIWEKPPIRTSVLEMLKNTFSEYEVEPIGIGKLLRKQPVIMAWNELSISRYYGWDIIKGKKAHSEYLVATPFLYHYVRRMAPKWLSTSLDKYAFSFQLQSIFNTRLQGIPHFVYTDRTVIANMRYPDFDPSNLYAPDWIALEKQIYQDAAVVFSRSSYISDSIISDYHCLPARVNCVYVGTNVHPYKSENNPDRFSKRNILFVGIDWERKGGPTLLKAFEIVSKTFPDASLTIIGPSLDINHPNINVLGKLSPAELVNYYQNASIFCMPTTNEAFGVAFIEAMNFSLPIVATNIGAVPDFVNNDFNGYLVDPGDVENLAKKLIDLLSSPEKCAAFGAVSKKICIDRYNWEMVGKKIRQAVLPFLT
jgi:glycosyltransferase involved in cell wall biosynthesis